MNNIKKITPKIITAVDLTHLQPGERIRIIGEENLRSRREFLEKMFKAGILVGFPLLLLPGCEPELIYKATDEEDCPSNTPCSQNQACACQSDSSATVPPKVVNTVPANDNSFSLDPNGVEIRLDIDKAMDSSTIAGAITISPAISGGFDIHFYDLSKSKSAYKTSLALFKPGTTQKLVLTADTKYTVVLKGTAKDVNGLYLDGNSNGVGGDDFTFSFTPIKRYVSCMCQNNCSCVGNTCSCQSYTCACVGYYGCTYDACTLYRV